MISFTPTESPVLVTSPCWWCDSGVKATVVTTKIKYIENTNMQFLLCNVAALWHVAMAGNFVTTPEAIHVAAVRSTHILYVLSFWCYHCYTAVMSLPVI